jgi:hypothetical protein
MQRYKYTILMVITFILAWAIGSFSAIDEFASSFATTNTIVFTIIAGAMYSFSFTAGLAVVLFAHVPVAAETHIQLALIGAFGGLLADLLIFRFIKDVILHELGKKAEAFIARETRSRGRRIIMQIIGAIIIASPFPDEIGLTFMGLSHITFWRLVILTYILDAIGIYILISAVTSFV